MPHLRGFTERYDITGLLVKVQTVLYRTPIVFQKSSTKKKESQANIFRRQGIREPLGVLNLAERTLSPIRISAWASVPVALYEVDVLCFIRMVCRFYFLWRQTEDVCAMSTLVCRPTLCADALARWCCS